MGPVLDPQADVVQGLVAVGDQELGEGAVASQDHHPLVEVAAVGGGHPALDSRHRLAPLQREAADVAQRADLRAAVGGAVGVGGVLDHRDARRPGDGQDGVHLRRVAQDVGHHHGPGARRDTAPDVLRVGRPGVRVDLAEDGGAPAVQDGGDAGMPGVGGDDHLVPRPHPGREQRAVQGGRPVAEAERVLRAHEGGELPLELRRGGVQVGAVERLRHGADLAVGDRLPAVPR